MTTKILNLDDFEAPTEKTVIIKGVKHHFQPLSVRDFIENLKTIEEYAKQDEVQVHDYLEHMLNLVRRAFPTIPAEQLEALSMDQLKALNEFVRGQTETEAAQGLSQSGKEAEKN